MMVSGQRDGYWRAMMLSAVERSIYGFFVEVSLSSIDWKSVDEDSALMAAVGLTYPDASRLELEFAAHWTAVLLICDDRGERGDYKVLKRIVSTDLDRFLETPLDSNSDALERIWRRTVILSAIVFGQSFQKTFYCEALASLKGMIWEMAWNSEISPQNLSEYLGLREYYCTMNVQVLMNVAINGQSPTLWRCMDPISLVIDRLVVRIGCLANDLTSWGAERHRGGESDAVPMLMKERNLNEDQALEALEGIVVEDIEYFNRLHRTLSIGFDGLSSRDRDSAMDRLNAHRPLIKSVMAWPQLTNRYVVDPDRFVMRKAE